MQDGNEDVNGDGNWDALDCKGPQGEQGPAGQDADTSELLVRIETLEARVAELEGGEGGGTNDDTDGDGVNNDQDNCPSASNADQNDADNDGIGNDCDDQWQVEICDDGNPNTVGIYDPGADSCTQTTISVDADGDGFTEIEGDCDDSNANVNPNATEVANGIDDDCDGQVDEGFEFTADSYEPNNSLSTRANLGNVADNANPVVFNANFHSTSDTVDWYQIRTLEVTSNTCFGEEPYLTRFIVTNIPTGSDYDLIIHDTGTNILGQSTNSGAANEEVQVNWSGQCLIFDERDFYIEVTNESGTASAQNYTLTIIHDLV